LSETEPQFQGKYLSWIYKNGHNFATGLPIDVMFGSKVGFPAELRFLA